MIFDLDGNVDSYLIYIDKNPQSEVGCLVGLVSHFDLSNRLCKIHLNLQLWKNVRVNKNII